MHRGPGKRAGGSGPAWRSPARTDTLAHSPSRTPGAAQPRDSSSDGRLRPHMPGSRGAAGGSLPPSPPSPPSPPPRRLLSPPPPLARAPAPPSAQASVQRVPRARDPGRARDALTPTRGEAREEEAEGQLAPVAGVPWQWPASPSPPPLRQAGPGRLLPLWPRSLELLVTLVPAPAPPRARQHPALLGPRDLAAGGE